MDLTSDLNFLIINVEHSLSKSCSVPYSCANTRRINHLQDGDSFKADVSDGSVHYNHLSVKHLGADLHQTEHRHPTRAYQTREGHEVLQQEALKTRWKRIGRECWKRKTRHTPFVIKVVRIPPQERKSQPYVRENMKS